MFFLADIFCHNQNLAQGKKIQCLDFQKDLLFFQHCSKFWLWEKIYVKTEPKTINNNSEFKRLEFTATHCTTKLFYGSFYIRLEFSQLKRVVVNALLQ